VKSTPCLPPAYRLPAACLPPACRQRQGKGRPKAGQRQARNVEFIIILLYHKFFITLGIFADNNYSLICISKQIEY